MSRYLGPRLRIVRRLGILPGLTQKTSNKKKPPGQHGSNSRKPSQYNTQLREKQKLRYNYGVTERQLLNYVKKSKKGKESTGKTLLKLLEMRLDNITFQLGFASSIVSARQLINHGHILVNGKSVDIPSFQCKTKDIISVKNSKSSSKLVQHNLQKTSSRNIPEHLSLDEEKMQGKVNSELNRKSILISINELLVIEYYSRKV